MRHSPSRTSRSPQGPNLAQWKVGPGLSPQPPLVVYCGLCLGLVWWRLPECMATSQDMGPSPPPGAAGSIWGSRLEPERGLDVPPDSRECLFIFLYSHPLGILSSPRMRELSPIHPVSHPPRTWTLPTEVGYIARLCLLCAHSLPLPSPSRPNLMPRLVISVHQPGILPSTFTHYLCDPHARIYSWEVRIERFRIAQEPNRAR